MLVIRRFQVALRKESVDRNTNFSGGAGQLIKSLSKEKAWIEIAVLELIPLTDPVALRKESVDRNTNSTCQVCVFAGRSRKESVDRNRVVSLNYKEVL